MSSSEKTPVTVLTGFLGAGKTTLLNHILKDQHGQRIAVIENEFGEIGIDHELVIRSDEEIFEMNNGCICCTVRGDLIRILSQLMKRRNKFDRILIETTGLADPGPVAQTFFMDEELAGKLKLDGVVTLVDAAHLEQHLEDSPEAMGQVAFADLLLINKVDLVSEEQLTALEARLAKINARAKRIRTNMAKAPSQAILEVGGFDLQRALEVDPKFLEPEYPFEWGGLVQLEAGGNYSLEFQEGPDPSMQLAFFASDGLDAEAAVRIFAEDEVVVEPGQSLAPGFFELVMPGRYSLGVQKSGHYTFFTQHHPDEFSTQFGNFEIVQSAEYKPDHEHDDEVSSVAVQLSGELDGEKFRDWISQLLQLQGPDIFRMKGVVAIAGQERRFVFQGVHMLFDSQPDREWGEEPKRCEIIFIGRNLDRQQLQEGVRNCLV
jgi:G3E family GTPase